MHSTVHSVVDLNVSEGAIGNSIPLLILQDGTISLLVLLWARHLMLHAWSAPRIFEQRYAESDVFTTTSWS
jgi:hypothetical protein